MKRDDKSQSPQPEDVAAHYASGYEANRLDTLDGKIDRERTRELLERFLPPAGRPMISLTLLRGRGEI